MDSAQVYVLAVGTTTSKTQATPRSLQTAGMLHVLHVRGPLSSWKHLGLRARWKTLCCEDAPEWIVWTRLDWTDIANTTCILGTEAGKKTSPVWHCSHCCFSLWASGLKPMEMACWPKSRQSYLPSNEMSHMKQPTSEAQGDLKIIIIIKKE